MKKQYLLYLALIPIVYTIYSIHKGYGDDSPFFYGFAENKETELSHNQNVLIAEILVSQGEEVKKGQEVMWVLRPELSEKTLNTSLSEENVAINHLSEIAEIQHIIELINIEQETYRKEVNRKIDNLKLKDAQNLALLETLKSVEIDSAKIGSESITRINNLQAEFSEYQKEKNKEIAIQESKISAIRSSLKLANRKIDAKKILIQEEEEKLKILAPANGVIGNIPTKKGENIKAFSTLMSFYEAKPTLVKGYVHESLLVHVKIGDSLKVASILKPENVIFGTVIGLGSRIVEIPERLRKLPTAKSYGREVIVSIPVDNSFLQKEKVSINTVTEIDYKVQSLSDAKRTEKKLKEKFIIK